jgi:PKD repeat protein
VGANSGCQANFTYNATPSGGSHEVYFTDLSTGSPTAWQWSFGDGTASNLQNPVHTYAGPGSYNVCLTISGSNCTSTFCQNVVIADSVNYHQIYGQVFAGNFPLSLGIAMIFSEDTTGNYTPYVAVSPIDSNGVYYFTLVPDGNYYILAVPIDPTGYMPTYYGNSISWEQATLIALGTENNPYNINLVESDQMTPGPGSASGQINMGDVSNAMADKINMIIMNAQGNAIGYTNVSESGAFTFPSLAYGTYYLHAEMPGVTSDVVMITLTAEIPHTDVVMTFSGNRITGIKDETTLANDWSVYPNPVVDNLHVSIDMKKATRAAVSVYNVSGQLMVNSVTELQSGSNSLTIPTAGLSAGAYTLRLYSTEGLNIHAKIIKTR